MCHHLCSKDMAIPLRLQDNGRNLAMKTTASIQEHGLGYHKLKTNDLYYYFTSLFLKLRLLDGSTTTVSSFGYKFVKDKSVVIIMNINIVKVIIVIICLAFFFTVSEAQLGGGGCESSEGGWEFDADHDGFNFMTLFWSSIEEGKAKPSQ